MDQSNCKRPRTIKTKRPPRDSSPNNVVIDGEVIEGEGGGVTLMKSNVLADIIEETDSVEQFIEEMSKLEAVEEDGEDLKLTCKKSEEELKRLYEFMSTLDREARHKIVDTLINIYKTDILTNLKQMAEDTSKISQDEEKLTRFKDACKSLLDEYKDISKKINGNNLNLQTDFLVNYHSNQSLNSSEAEIQHLLTKHSFIRDISNATIDKEMAPNAKKTCADLPLRRSPSSEKALSKIMGKGIKQPIANVEYRTENLPGQFGYHVTPKTSASLYRSIKKAHEDPEIPPLKQLKSEGVQVTKGPPKKKKGANLEFFKAYKYIPTSSSDITIQCPYGCQLRLKKPKSETDIQRLDLLNAGRLDTDASDRSSYVDVKRNKSSMDLINTGAVKVKPMIEYADPTLHTGLSEIQFSKVLFKNQVDQENSMVEVPFLDQSKLKDFNANYLLHSVRLGEAHPTSVNLQVYQDSLRNIAVSEEEYHKWLREKQWQGYTKEPEPWNDDYSASQVSLYRASGRSLPNLQPWDLLTSVNREFFYEHEVFFSVVEFLMTLNAHRTKRFSRVERLGQMLVLLGIYYIWRYFERVVFWEARGKLWKY